MLIIYHDGNKVVEVDNANSSIVDKRNTLTIAEVLVALAQEYPDTILVWCHVLLKSQLNILEIEALFHHRKLLFSYNPSDGSFIGKAIGYVEESPFIKINKGVSFPSWQMSSCVGAIHSEVVLAIRNEMPFDKDFDYFLCSLAKLGMKNGLLCYSEPRLLKQHPNNFSVKSSSYILFRFVKQHYKSQWVFLLFFNLMVYEGKFPVFPLLYSLFFKNRGRVNIDLDRIKVQSSKKRIENGNVDVIIPSIGRKDYLYEVLKDLKAQTHLPINVIIVEQNPDRGSESELDYLSTEEWPFVIKHTFTHQAGACNARNIALGQTKSEWVFFADDDIRVGIDFIQKFLEQIYKFGAEAVTLKCYQKVHKQKDFPVFQWGTFGSGCSVVSAASLQQCSFKMGYEFGYGEDGDFGMQLRNQGVDILYLPEPSILHLKAPMGGFRTKPALQWQNESIQPKPSPTILLFLLLHHTKEQIRGYKTILFFKYYNRQTIRNPFRYYIHFQRQWAVSIYWTKTIKQQNEI